MRQKSSSNTQDSVSLDLRGSISLHLTSLPHGYGSSSRLKELAGHQTSTGFKLHLFPPTPAACSWVYKCNAVQRLAEKLHARNRYHQTCISIRFWPVCSHKLHIAGRGKKENEQPTNLNKTHRPPPPPQKTKQQTTAPNQTTQRVFTGQLSTKLVIYSNAQVKAVTMASLLNLIEDPFVKKG